MQTEDLAEDIVDAVYRCIDKKAPDLSGRALCVVLEEVRGILASDQEALTRFKLVTDDMPLLRAVKEAL